MSHLYLSVHFVLFLPKLLLPPLQICCLRRDRKHWSMWLRLGYQWSKVHTVWDRRPWSAAWRPGSSALWLSAPSDLPDPPVLTPNRRNTTDLVFIILEKGVPLLSLNLVSKIWFQSRYLRCVLHKHHPFVNQTVIPGGKEDVQAVGFSLWKAVWWHRKFSTASLVNERLCPVSPCASVSAVSFVSACRAAGGVSPAGQRVRPGDTPCPRGE